MTPNLIPFQVEAQRVIQLLAKQIYQSPLALLRENTQNAFDAIRQRLQIDAGFDPRIDIALEPCVVTVRDNGIGMTAEDLRKHYWTAGSSSKNTKEARAAGVVGTFGIGAMANFGIAEELAVETESALTGERTICRAERARLSLKEDCIELRDAPSMGQPGTTITARIAAESQIQIQQAKDYIRDFVLLLDIPVYINDELVSRRPVDEIVSPVSEAWSLKRASARIGPRLRADIHIIVSNNAEIWMHASNLFWSAKNLVGQIVLRTGQPVLRTFRSGFGLATASVSSIYQFGGIADLLTLEPTAGREAITADGMQLLQSMVVEIDGFVSEILSSLDECDASTPFMSWVVAHSKYEFCGRLRMSISPGDKIQLQEIAARSVVDPMKYYDGVDTAVIRLHSSDESPLLVAARTNPRRTCERQFLQRHAKIVTISNAPVVTSVRDKSSFSPAESALAFRVETVLETDYFLRITVELGDISHGLPVAVTNAANGLMLTMNPAVQSVRLLVDLYDREYTAFSSMVKDFVRNIVFPRVADYVPSSTRQGAEAFLKAIRRPREYFEIADDDLGDLPKIWSDYTEGLISIEQAVERSKAAVRVSVQVVETAENASSVVPDVIENEQALEQSAGVAPSLDPVPAITRLETSTSSKLLVIPETEPALRGYRCFLAITDKAREEMGEFFLQPHTTSVVWGGQKTLFIFLHHSKQFGLYYDLQTREPIDAASGGGTYPTAAMVLKDRIFIPIPDEIRASFVPKPNERKRFDVRADILRTEEGH